MLLPRQLRRVLAPGGVRRCSRLIGGVPVPHFPVAGGEHAEPITHYKHDHS